MQGLARAIRSCQETLKNAIPKDWHARVTASKDSIFSRFGSVSSSIDIREKGLENVTVADVLMTKGEEKTGTWLSCQSNDTVYDAVKNMAQNNIGSLVVLKPGEEQVIAGIITERDYLQKIIAQGRSSKQTRVGQIMTVENNLITVSSDTNILKAMQLMTEHHIRHVPVINSKIVGMISIVDVVQAVVQQQRGELKRLNDFIKGEYY
ncbi:CBS domain-containing protein CBSX3, mitochondrial isoform X1 [Eucalyptus grandis]|uniref:Uncharacterized protein n=3 Tax=Eucalyptus grandis TaxID=71139 RepID=A0ACC3KG61_EUCGR|nr:CBS domain-containing protein CBSX3, mitochondrial isoform X1 [Eucalyptus grandis]KAK3425364.1 hypothetical protein EUGRSUZ_F01886 [Eucalyptus grandis]